MTPIEVILERNRQTGNIQCSLDLHAGGRAHKTYSFVINALDYYCHYSHMNKKHHTDFLLRSCCFKDHLIFKPTFAFSDALLLVHA